MRQDLANALKKGHRRSKRASCKTRGRIKTPTDIENIEKTLDVSSDVWSCAAIKRANWYGSDSYIPMRWNAARRFLQSNIGRRWDDVWSEYRQVVKNNSWDATLCDRLISGNVHLHVIERDGKFFAISYREIDLSTSNNFYVHPHTNKLCKGPATHKQAQRERAAVLAQQHHKIRRIVGTGLQYHKVAGVWYGVMLAPSSIIYNKWRGWILDGCDPFLDLCYRKNHVFDKYTSFGPNKSSRDDRWAVNRLYGDCKICTKFWSANKQEIKKYGLD